MSHPRRSFTCGICMELVPSISIFKATDWCDHPFCGLCISSYVAAKIDDGVAEVQCPSPGCEAMLDPVACRRLVPRAQFARWCDLLCESAVRGFARSRCPNSSCREMIINECGGDGGGAGRFKCPSCHQSGRFRDADANNVHRLAKRRRWKRCPNCNIYVERLGGCKTIMCRCQTQFCYGCGRRAQYCACRKGRDKNKCTAVLSWWCLC